MICEQVKKKIPAFLDDLLNDSDYQEVGTHLDQCPSCEIFARSTGSLTYRVKELGDVRMPEDLSRTILYKVRSSNPAVKKVPSVKEPEAPRSAVPAIPAARTQVPAWAWVVMTALAVWIGADIYRGRPRSIETYRVPVVVEKGSPAHGAKPVRHWHYHVSRAGRNEVLKILKEMDIPVDHGSPSTLIVTVPDQSTDEFANRIGSMSGYMAGFQDVDSLQDVESGPVEVSIYMEERRTV